MRNLKGYISSMAAAVVLACCAYPNLTRAADNQPKGVISAAEAQRYVGKDFLIPPSLHIPVCPGLKTMESCVQRSGHFKVVSVGPITDSLVGLQVTFDGVPTGWTALSPDVIDKLSLIQLKDKLSIEAPVVAPIYPSFLDRLPKKAADERRKLPGVILGMHEDAVLAGAWGAPLSKKVQRVQHAVRNGDYYDVLKKEWRYPNHNALHFTNGILDGIDR